ncbi:MAG: efflux RND transporter periplasmic adaptor subunit [Bacteroidales bacterium]
MKTNRMIYVTALVALAVGFIAGRLIFGGPSGRTGEEKVAVQEETGLYTTWTCSMHPQIRQSEPGDCHICGMDLIPLDETDPGKTDPAAIHLSETAMQLANVRTASVEKTEASKTVRLYGMIDTDERLVYTQPAHIPGRIEKLMVNYSGQYIRKGQAIATIYAPELVTAQEELFEAEKVKNEQPALLAAAKEKIKNWKIPESLIEQTLRSGNPQREFDIPADRSGFVMERRVKEGDYVARGEAMYTLADLSRVWVLFDVYEQDLIWIHPGNLVNFTVKSLPGESFQGKVSYIDPIIDPVTRVARARAVVTNDGLKLKPGMFVTGRVDARLEERSGLISVPVSAVMWTGKRSLVYVRTGSENGARFAMREVVLGPMLDDRYLIESGLEEGEEVAVNGTFSIDAAAQLAGKPSMMLHPEAKTMEVPQSFRRQITAAAQVYFDVKNALVNDLPGDARQAAGKLAGLLGEVGTEQLETSARRSWMEIYDNLSGDARLIAATDEIGEQRRYFNRLSENILEMTERFGQEADTVYRLYCPMAFDNTGAFWLSESAEVLNPYFGESMLRCGEVKETYFRDVPVLENERDPEGQPSTGHNH